MLAVEIEEDVWVEDKADDEAVCSCCCGVPAEWKAAKAAAAGRKCLAGGGVNVPYGPGVANGYFATCRALMTTAVLW